MRRQNVFVIVRLMALLSACIAPPSAVPSAQTTSEETTGTRALAYSF